MAMVFFLFLVAVGKIFLNLRKNEKTSRLRDVSHEKGREKPSPVFFKFPPNVG